MESLADCIAGKIERVAGLYHRLAAVVAPAGGGKTAALREVSGRIGAPLVNVNLELSRRMRASSARRRAAQPPALLREIVRGVCAEGEIVLLDNIEMLFDPALGQDPLGLLRGLSRDRTVVAAWNGSAAGGFLTYAAPGHGEHRRYPLGDLQIAAPRGAA